MVITLELITYRIPQLSYAFVERITGESRVKGLYRSGSYMCRCLEIRFPKPKVDKISGQRFKCFPYARNVYVLYAMCEFGCHLLLAYL